jgi:hypothetical protein
MQVAQGKQTYYQLLVYGIPCVSQESRNALRYKYHHVEVPELRQKILSVWQQRDGKLVVARARGDC